MPPPTLQVTPQITESFGAPIKQYAGQKQVTQAVRVQVPGKHFTGLSASEQKLDYWVSAMEFRERHAFERNLKAWGSAHTGPGIRFVSEDDAVDDQTTTASGPRYRYGTSGATRPTGITGTRSCCTWPWRRSLIATISSFMGHRPGRRHRSHRRTHRRTGRRTGRRSFRCRLGG